MRNTFLTGDQSVRTLLDAGIQRLAAAGVQSARQEAEWLLAHLLDTSSLELYLQERSLSQQMAQRFLAHIAARARGVPLQYLLGEAEFFGERFTVEPGVFIPRQETEIIVEAALHALRPRAAQGGTLRIADLGTGSGCIAVTLARALAACVVIGVEVSWTALCVAQRNVLRHGLAERVQLAHGWWTKPLRGPLDAIIANPPYIPTWQVDRLPFDVRQEPRMSLDGGRDGLRDLLQVIDEAPRLLRPGGLLALECGEEQVDQLVKVASAASWVAQVTPLHDLAARPRGLLLYARP
jgi:release factor glutamine methyltransferase